MRISVIITTILMLLVSVSLAPLSYKMLQSGVTGAHVENAKTIEFDVPTQDYPHYDDFSVKPRVCDEDHLSLCDNEDDCEDADGCWYDDECHKDWECNSNSDCGTDGFVGNTFCGLDGNTYQDYRTYTCSDEGTEDADCSYITTMLLVDTCSYGCTDGECNALSQPISLTAGVNLISLPYFVDGGVSLNELTSTDCTFEQFDSLLCTGSEAAYWNPLTQSYDCLDMDAKLDAGKGYFVQVAGDCSIDIPGSPFAWEDIFLFGNLVYNLIGVSDTAVNVADAFGTCDVYSPPHIFVYGATTCSGVPYNVGGDSGCSNSPYDYCYCEVSVLEPGLGYSVILNDNCILGG